MIMNAYSVSLSTGLQELIEKKETVLHAQPLLGSNSGEMLCHEYMAMLSKWNIEKSKIIREMQAIWLRLWLMVILRIWGVLLIHCI